MQIHAPLFLALSLCLSACQGEKPVAQMPPPAPEPQIPAEANSQAAQQAAEQAAQQAMQGMAQMMAGVQTGAARAVVEPMPFRELYGVFPEVSGWTQGKTTGQQINMPYKISQAEVKYTKDASQVKMTVIDGGWSPMLLAPYAMFLKAGFDRETETGFERSSTFGGQPGWEKWDDSHKDGQINVVVADRFLVQLDGSSVASADVLKDFASRADFSLLVKAAESAAPAAPPAEAPAP